MESRLVRVARFFCSLSSSLSGRGGAGGLPRPPGPTPSAAAHLLGLGGRQRRGLLVGLGGGGVDQVAGRLQRAAELAERERQAQDRVPAQPGVLVGGQPAGPADVALRGPGGERRHRRVDAVAADQHLGDRRGRRGAQRQVAAARADRRQDVVDGGARRAARPCAAVGSSIALSRALPRLVGEPVGVLDDDHLPAAAGRVPAGPGDQGAGVVDADGQLAGVDDLDVGVGAGQHGVAGVAVAAAAVGALQRGREGPGGGRPAGARAGR